jgi:hypothetical protein
MRAMIEAMVNAHASAPELYELLLTEVPHRTEGTREFAGRLHGAFRLAIAARAHELKTHRDLDKVVFIVTHMVDALSHGAVLRPPSDLSLAAPGKKPCARFWHISADKFRPQRCHRLGRRRRGDRPARQMACREPRECGIKMSKNKPRVLPLPGGRAIKQDSKADC